MPLLPASVWLLTLLRLVEKVAGAPAQAPAPVAEEAPDEDTDEVRSIA